MRTYCPKPLDDGAKHPIFYSKTIPQFNSLYNFRMDFYNLNICGLKRKLPLIYVGKKTRIASFSILGDVELVQKLSIKISKELKKYEFDCLVGPEVKVVPLIHEVAKNLKQKRYVICRKSVKSYMISPIVIKPLAHFPKHIKPLVLDGPDAKYLNGKKVVIIDDVVSTGVTMRMISHLMKKVNAQVVCYIAALKQGQQFDQIDNLIYFSELPVFKEKK
jgi:adenine phosphoribosyltransferase